MISYIVSGQIHCANSNDLNNRLVSTSVVRRMVPLICFQFDRTLNALHGSCQFRSITRVFQLRSILLGLQL